MAKFPPIDQIMPFRPVASGTQKGDFPVIKDDRRDFMSRLSGETISNEVTITPTGAWPVMNTGQPALREALRLTLPRSEPVTLSFHPWDQSTDRFRGAIRYYAHVSCPTTAIVERQQGRIIVEWGSGRTREWTYFDMAAGSFHIPACTHVTVMGWMYNYSVQLGVSAQIGYSHGPHDAYWTMMYSHNATASYAVLCPHYSREITANLYSATVDAEGYVQSQNAFAPPTQYWLMRPAITPNPPVIPYPPVNVPLSAGYQIRTGISFPGAIPGYVTVIAIIKIRI